VKTGNSTIESVFDGGQSRVPHNQQVWLYLIHTLFSCFLHILQLFICFPLVSLSSLPFGWAALAWFYYMCTHFKFKIRGLWLHDTSFVFFFFITSSLRRLQNSDFKMFFSFRENLPGTNQWIKSSCLLPVHATHFFSLYQWNSYLWSWCVVTDSILRSPVKLFQGYWIIYSLLLAYMLCQLLHLTQMFWVACICCFHRGILKDQFTPAH